MFLPLSHVSMGSLLSVFRTSHNWTNPFMCPKSNQSHMQCRGPFQHLPGSVNWNIADLRHQGIQYLVDWFRFRPEKRCWVTQLVILDQSIIRDLHYNHATGCFPFVSFVFLHWNSLWIWSRAPVLPYLTERNTKWVLPIVSGLWWTGKLDAGKDHLTESSVGSWIKMSE